MQQVDRVILLTGAASAALFGWMHFAFRRPLEALLPNADLPDLAVGDHARESVAAFFRALEGSSQAAALFHNMLLGPELYFPLVFAAFLFLFLLRVSEGAQMFSRPVTGPLKAIVLAQPLTYVLADYAENAAFFALLQSPEPSGWLLDLAPWLTAFKFVGVSLAAVFLLRFTLLKRLQPKA
ncbi:hypothetical protein NOF55_16400 [Rhizobiaceae bacterium BDR2-2]|uniref:Uncharacterized protein n=1 Tax=Ectorhizobium quercum TaxID=2965071 RepID=A0AAE3N1X8_9HYPH|nr:hypothetical protein [Ectorhizobium quercum]MCX8996265.1 hypothetical protein [Ectorhizobium quercum]MCX8998696.1 hypothetical protein [Ectorhizobium quercum]